MGTKAVVPSCIEACFLIFISALCVSAFSPIRNYRSSSHVLTRRSRPSDPLEGPLQEPADYKEHPLHAHNAHTMHREESLHRPSIQEEEESVGKALEETGLTRIIYDEEELITDDEYYDDDVEGDDPNGFHHEGTHLQIKDIKNLSSPKKYNEDLAKVFDKKENQKLESSTGENEYQNLFSDEEDADSDSEESSVTDAFPGVTEPSMMSSHSTDKENGLDKKDNPVVLPVTTEGKTNAKQKTEDPLKVYGFPKELLPIMPGGGSRFEDVEREKLERKKMSQTKGSDDDSAESGSSHEAEGLYSSASLSSLSLCFYWLMSFHRLDRILLL